MKKLFFITIIFAQAMLFLLACRTTPAAAPEAGELYLSQSGFELVWIPAGTFTMGSPETEPLRDGWSDWAETQHDVTLTRGFWMGRHLVTQAQWELVMEGNNNGICASPSFFTEANGIPPADGESDANRPVESISWYDVLVFSNRLSIMEGLSPAYEIQAAEGGRWTTNPDLWGTIENSEERWKAVRIVANSTGYRLPTEAQWEFACRANMVTAFNNGNNFDNPENPEGFCNELLGTVAWFYTNSEGMTREVGQKAPNGWGLYDMHGNVWEWCWDWFGAYPEKAQTDPAGTASGTGRVQRGGSWAASAGILRSAQRSGANPSERSGDLGFRVVRP